MTLDFMKLQDRFNHVVEGNYSPAEKALVYAATIQELERVTVLLKEQSEQQLRHAIYLLDKKGL